MQFPEYLGEGLVYQTDSWEYRSSRFVVQMHGPLSMFARHMGWPELGSTLHETAAFMEAAVLRRADLLLASSHATADFCAAEYGVPRARVQVIHSGVDTDAFAAREPHGGPGGPRFLFVGNIAGNKGVHRVVRAVRTLSERCPGIVLRIVGRGELGSLGVESDDPRFEVLGYVPHADLPEHYAWCDVFAGPSTYEPGPGNVYLEAMAAGRPILAGATGGAPEVVTDGQTGLLIDPHDEDALVRSLDQLAADPQLRRRLGAEGRRQAEREFALPVYLDKVESAYERTLAAPVEAG